MLQPAIFLRGSASSGSTSSFYSVAGNQINGKKNFFFGFEMFNHMLWRQERQLVLTQVVENNFRVNLDEIFPVGMRVGVNN
jgi:hypothetical protein